MERKRLEREKAVESGIAFYDPYRYAFRGWHYWKPYVCRGELNNKTWGIFSSVTLSSNRTNPLTFQLDIPINFAVPPNPFNDR